MSAPETFIFNGKEYPKITLQSIFNLAWQEFIVEGKEPCYNASGTCAYENESGTRHCAIGLALPKGHPALKSRETFSFLVNDYPELWAQSLLDEGMLNTFQIKLHDDLAKAIRQSNGTYAGVWIFRHEELKRKYKEVAENYGLKTPEEN